MKTLLAAIAVILGSGCATYGASGSYHEKVEYVANRYGSTTDKGLTDFNACTSELVKAQAVQYNNSAKGQLGAAFLGHELQHVADEDSPPTVADIMTGRRPGAQKEVDSCMVKRGYTAKLS
jgi:GH18 family chitinase